MSQHKNRRDGNDNHKGSPAPPEAHIYSLRILYNREIELAWSSSLEELTRCATVVAETSHGPEMAKVLGPEQTIPDEERKNIRTKILREATEKDLENAAENDKKNREAFELCKEKIKKHKLPMKLVGAHNFLEGNKILFYFTSDGRVDFRNLVKDLASVFRTRIELRQIGVRDEAQLVGGCGVCGRPLCCAACKPMTQPVSIKMAKEQNLALNSAKISGVCGRLLCCLAYEYDTYKKMNKNMPKTGSRIWIGEKKAVVKDVNVITGKVKILNDSHQYIEVDADAIKYNKATGKRYIPEE